VPRRIFERKRDEIIGDWTKLHLEALHNLYSLPNIIVMIRAGQVTRMREEDHIQ
jgi:hypothetical protein